MRVMVIIKADKDSEAGIQPTKQTREMFAAMGKFNAELVKAGVLLAADGVQPSSKGKRVRFSGQERTVTDGPFTETKELVAGFWLWQVKSMEEAVEWLKRAPFDRGTEVEIRPVYDVVDFPADVITPEHAARMRALRDELQKKGREAVIAGLDSRAALRTTVQEKRTFDLSISGFPRSSLKMKRHRWRKRDDCNRRVLVASEMRRDESLQRR